MRLEYKVSPWRGRWRVQRGYTEAIMFDSFDSAMRTAQNLAMSAATAGNTAVVKVEGDDPTAQSPFAADPPTLAQDRSAASRASTESTASQMR